MLLSIVCPYENPYVNPYEIPGCPQTADRASGKAPSPLPDDARGAISALILSLTGPLTLRPNATDTVLRLTYRVRPPAEWPSSCRAFFSDGLAASGQPFMNIITHLGRSWAPTLAQGLVLVASESAPFIRGDANDDGKLDIADAVWSLEELFRSSARRTLCRNAADANDDGETDISDPISVIDYLFVGGPPPPPPFPACGREPDPGSAAGCPPGSTRCPAAAP